MTRKSLGTAVRVVLLVALIGVAWWLREASIPTKVQGAAMVLCALLVADLGFKVTRRLVPFEVLRRHGAAQTAIFAIVGTVYGLIAAFVVIVVWEDFSSTDATVAREANALADLERMSAGFAVVERRQVQGAARSYAYQVIHEEWPAMAEGRSSERAQAALIELWHVYTDMGPAERAHPLYDHSIDRLTEMDDNRRLRLAAGSERVPAIMWGMLYAGGSSVVILAYLFESPRDWFQRFIIALLAGTIMFSIFLVVALEGPFDGDVSVNPAPFQYVLDHMQTLEE
ncbi:MAG: DUF4239 domain-containing protein [Actinomadura sp.]